ncbi:sugar kinase [Pleionea mediterranea]|uniref:Sugar kinase n=1 Tax=Pleionea mediterranea TaxID=523701 RepID=A0A316FLT0_9GAMM|nr:sugar kinase [Pleionea mediterranea]PWK49871.1 hypothetical protein C8D97_10732 [Pleionea mediterranea]
MNGLDPRVVLVHRETRLDGLKRRYNTIEQAKFYVEHLGADFDDYIDEDRQYKQSLKSVEASYRKFARVQKVDRSFLPNFVFSGDETVVVVGQDGLVANTLKYVKSLPVVGVNPDPARYDGVLLPFNVKEIGSQASDTVFQRCSFQNVTLAKAELSNGQELVGVNDLFIGPKLHTSARYILQWGSEQELQSSSGIIVSTGLGSTGWFQSLIAGAVGITGSCSDELLRLKRGFAWDERYLYFCVREPFPSRRSQTNLVFGKTSSTKSLIVESQMPENGLIFSDGMLDDSLNFHAGLKAKIGLADWQARLVA